LFITYTYTGIVGRIRIFTNSESDRDGVEPVLY